MSDDARSSLKSSGPLTSINDFGRSGDTATAAAVGMSHVYDRCTQVSGRFCVAPVQTLASTVIPSSQLVAIEIIVPGPLLRYFEPLGRIRSVVTMMADLWLRFFMVLFNG